MDDLIIREAMKNAIAVARTNYNTCPEYNELFNYFSDVVSAMIDEMPAVDAEPVRHGKWERNDALTRYDEGMYCVNYYDCNKCGYTISDRHGLYRYCPDCGAKMDMEKEDE